MRIPFLDLKGLHDSIGGELSQSLAQVVSSSAFINGPQVREFEKAWAIYCDVPAAVGAANGTSALHTILACLGIGNHDEVICPSHTFVATAESIRLTGAKPVFVDIDPKTWLIDPKEIENAITSRTRAIVPVHLYGMPCQMDAINELACSRDLPVIEDAAQAHGAVYQGKRAGGLGLAAAFSFFPGKNLGAFGDAGGITTLDADLAYRMSLYVNHGREAKFENAIMGTNYRLDTIQAAILLVKLRYLDEWNQRRAAMVARYRERLSEDPFKSLPVIMQQAPPGAVSANHLFVVQIPNRGYIKKALAERGVATGLHYPVPCHLQPSMKDISRGEGSLIRTERVAESILSLPVCPTMTPDHVDQVCDTLLIVLNSMKSGMK